MIVLGIESTCDETGIAIVKDGKKILSNVIASSSDIHEKYGGVFPELACRRHMDVMLPVLEEALKQAKVTPNEIDLIAVAKGPGLIGALLIGMNFAKGLAIAWNKPFIGVHHVEAHLYAAMMDLDPIPLPALGIALSGGHTLLFQIKDVGVYEPISTTIDDAIGEAFDKVASLLNLSYPGGPHIEKLAEKGDPKTFSFSAGNVKRSPLDFSFSGLKTAVRTATLNGGKAEDIAASFQETAFQDVAKKAKKAAEKFPCQAVFLGGGVTVNQRLKKILEEHFEIPLFFPPKKLCLDNGAMIAALGAKKYRGVSDSLDLEVKARIPIV